MGFLSSFISINRIIMTYMKKYTILFWITTIIIFLAEGVMPIVTLHNPMTVAGFTSLGYPVYFITMLAIWKAIGGLAIIIPQVPARIKEWAYAGFGIDFICAFISICVVAGFNAGSLLPLVALVILAISYVSYRKIKKA
ncbi:MAG: hypothetical protein JWM20_11 [Patescibacteria group bacterium]|nr:hypothetical protein [Patescibacteria group bacterium]